MARIIGALASSHTPTIGFAFDRNKRDDPAWAPIFEHYEPLQHWLDEKKPDVLVFVYNDHVTSFFFDHYSAFTLGIGERFPWRTKAAAPRALPPVDGHPALARAHRPGADGRRVRHVVLPGQAARPRPVLAALDARAAHDAASGPRAIMPLQVGVLQFPIPSARRCYKLGQALRRAIESYPEDLKVAIVATGGLSHQVHGERVGLQQHAVGHAVPRADREGPRAPLRADPRGVRGAAAASRASEVIMWLVMRGALSSSIRKVHQSYYLPSMTAIATAIYENEASADVGSNAEEYRHHMAPATRRGRAHSRAPIRSRSSAASKRTGSTSSCTTWSIPPTAQRFKDDPEASFAAAGLTDEERDLVRRRDWRGMIHYGVIFFMLEKLGAVVGVSNLHIYAAMRGETLETFQQTRNAPGALYSVAGKDAGALAWDTNAKS